MINTYTVENILMDAFSKKKLETVKWIFSRMNDIIKNRLDYNKLFLNLCKYNNYELLLFLLNSNIITNNNTDLYQLFSVSCQHGYKNIALLLLKFDMTIKNKIDYDLYEKCINNEKYHIALWLKELNNNCHVKDCFNIFKFYYC
jgi:hypothetical protein